jgi:chemotaxis protein MotB
MQIPSKYIFFLKERIRETTLFLHKTTLSDNKKDANLNTRINSYKEIVKNKNSIINKIKNEASARISYAKSDEIKKIIKNNGEVNNSKREGIEEKVSGLKKQLKKINTSLDKKKSKNKNTQKEIILLRDEIKILENSNVILKNNIKEISIKAKKHKEESIKAEKFKEEELNKMSFRQRAKLEGKGIQSDNPQNHNIQDECESFYSITEEIINNNLELNKLTEAMKISTMLMESDFSEKTRKTMGEDVFIKNTSNNLNDYGKAVTQNIKKREEKHKEMLAQNSELNNELMTCKQDLEAMEEINSKSSGDSLGGASFFVSFCDIISVLLCFFILFFAMSKIDGEKASKLSSTFSNQTAKKVIFNTYASKEELEMLEKVKELILDNVSPDAITGSKTMTIKHVISGEDLFYPGETEMSESGMELLMQKLENSFTGEIKEIIVEGHTDDQELFAFPENLKKYETNTRLSAARAITVAKIIEEKLNTSNNIIGIRAYGSNRPLKPNISDLYRALNRRVVIIIKKGREKEIIKDNKKVNENTLPKN